jgi:hypothetical protein
MGRAIVKRFTRAAVLTQLKELPTAEEKMLAQYFEESFIERRRKDAASIVPEAYLGTQWCVNKLKPKRLRACIIEALKPTLDQEYEDWGDWREWRYCKRAGPWYLMTYVDVGGQGQQLSYEHSIVVPQRVCLVEGVSILSWLGIAGQTDWQELDDSDAESTAEALARIVAHFMEAAPKLLEGLTPDLSKVNCIR